MDESFYEGDFYYKRSSDIRPLRKDIKKFDFMPLNVVRKEIRYYGLDSYTYHAEAFEGYNCWHPDYHSLRPGVEEFFKDLRKVCWRWKWNMG